MENKAYEKDEEEVVPTEEVENDLSKTSSPSHPRESPSRATLHHRPHIEEAPSCLEDGILKIPSGDKCDLENSSRVVEKEEEEEDEERCGFFGFYPKCLQRQATPMAFLAVFSVQNVLQGATFSMMVSSSTSLERHFRFSSKDLGSLIMLGEIGPMLLSLVMSHFGGRSHRPRFMGASLALVALGLFVGFSTFLVYPPPVLTESGQLATSRKFCRPEDVASYLMHGSTTASPPSSLGSSSGDVDESCSRSNNLAYFLWFISFTLNAVGASSIYTIGAPYLDDSIEKKEAPIYFAISIAVRVLGPLIGFSLSSVLLNIYIYPGHEYGITPEDPRWIGAWWIGSLVFSIIIFLFSFVIVLFPRNMDPKKGLAKEKPNKQELLKKDSIEGSTIKDSFKTFLKDMGMVLTRLLKNKVVVHSTIADFFGYNAIEGIFFWLPKYFEHQFRVDKSTAALYTGVAGISSIFLGVLGGGVFISQLRPSARLLANLLVLLTGIYTISVAAMMFITCDFNNDLPGTLSEDGMSLELHRACSAGCRCDLQEFIPVCVEDEGGNSSTTFFSPCHAGCPDVPVSKANTYSDCMCGRGTLGLQVRPGYCRKTCSGFLIYNVINIIIKSFISFGSIGGVLISLRCVAPEDKAVALGFKSTVLALVVFVNPLIFGSLADASCLVWEESCGQRGACWVYDTRMFGYRLHGTAAVLLSVCTFFFYMMARNIGDLQLFDEPRTSSGFSSFTDSARTWKNRTLSFFSRQSTIARENSISSSSSSSTSRIKERAEDSTGDTSTALEIKVTLPEEEKKEEEEEEEEEVVESPREPSGHENRSPGTPTST
ncbi:solute carrier organic anion transporter family member 74D-like [Oratosquilla oratoria]|uniref:solute carrier organic anion transporter family member 74D-like n=1 Tax=Oratosquilla oratoria TaxID=337810 RepID=UPI003F75972A